MISWILSAIAILVLFVLYKVVILATADGDLTVLSKNMNPAYYKDKVVWVTGASSGIGEELCYQLSRFGAKLILSARSVDKLESVRTALATPENAKILPVDLNDPGATRQVTKKAVAFFGKIDILVNNAGISTRAFFVGIQEPVHRRVMEVNLFAPWILTHDTLPGMMSSGFGHVVNVSSIAGKFGSPSRTSYSAAKFGIIGLMDSLRYEVAGKNVFITNVCPGPVKTAVAENALLHDGSINNKKDPFIEGGMSVQRCVELMLIAVSHQLPEVWISKHPALLGTYISQYAPGLMQYILQKRALKSTSKNE